jgi:hypothetical protein
MWGLLETSSHIGVEPGAYVQKSFEFNQALKSRDERHEILKNLVLMRSVCCQLSHYENWMGQTEPADS